MRMLMFFIIMTGVFGNLNAQGVNYGFYIVDRQNQLSCTEYQSDKFTYLIDTVCLKKLDYIDIRDHYGDNINQLISCLSKADSVRHLRIFTTFNDDVFGDFKVAKMPFLDTLFIYIDSYEQTYAEIHNLPNTIKDLVITVNKETLFDLVMNQYPSELKSLSINNISRFSFFTYPLPLPEGIEKLSISDFQNSVQDFNLPTTLKELNIEVRKFETRNLVNLFSLKKLSLKLSQYPENIEFINPQLDELNLDWFAITSAPTITSLNYPASVTKLKISNFHIRNYALRESLKSFLLNSSSYAPGNLFEDLPKNLDNLYLGNITLDYPISFKGKIKKLNLFNVKSSVSDILYNLPNELEDLTLNRTNFHTINMFPSTLENIVIGEAPFEDVPDFPSKLKSLDLSNLPNLKCLPYFPMELMSYVYNNIPFNCIPNETNYIHSSEIQPVCDDTSLICRYKVPTSIKISPEISDFNIVPNPVHQTFQLVFDENVNGHLRIINMAGSILSEDIITLNHYEKDVSFLKSGVYIVQWIVGDHVKNKKFIKL